MKLKNKEIEVIENICMHDKRYRVWKDIMNHSTELDNLDNYALIWTEATKIIMELKKEQHDKRKVLTTWNNGLLDNNIVAAIECALFMIEHGDAATCGLNDKDIESMTTDIIMGFLREKIRDNYGIMEACLLYYCYDLSDEAAVIERICKEEGENLSMEDFGDEDFEDEEPEFYIPIFINKPDLESSIMTVKHAINTCPNERMGMSITMLLIEYYNNLHSGKLETYIDLMMAKMKAARKIMPHKCYDITCPFDEAQIKSSGISKEAKIVLAVMNDMFKGEHMNKNGSYSNNIDYAIAMFAVLSIYGYWKNQRKEYCEMLKQMFGVDVKADTIGKWIRQYGDNYEEWYKGDDGKEVKAARRKRIAQNFAERIDKVKTYKLRKIKN